MSIEPLSISFFQWGTHSHLLNPSNAEQGPISKYLGKPVRAIARLIYTIACMSIIPVVGTLYHALNATQEYFSSLFDASGKIRTWQHLQAAGIDALIAITSIGLAFAVFKATKSVPVFKSDDFIENMRTYHHLQERNAFIAQAVVLLAIFPISFAVAPDSLRVR